MKRIALLALALVPFLARADETPDPAVASTGDVDPSAWNVTNESARVVLWSDANGNYSSPTNSPLVFKDEVAGLVESNAEAVAYMEILRIAADDALELTRLATYNVSTLPTLFATPQITSFKVSVAIDTNTFDMAVTAFQHTSDVETKTLTVDGGTTNVVCRRWILDYATTDDLQTIVPDFACVQVLQGTLPAGDRAATYLSEDLYSVVPVTGETRVIDGHSYSYFYEATLWLPTAYDQCFIRLDIDPEDHAAATDGSVTDIGGVPDGFTGDVTWADGTVIHFKKGLAVETGSNYTPLSE